MTELEVTPPEPPSTTHSVSKAGPPDVPPSTTQSSAKAVTPKQPPEPPSPARAAAISNRSALLEASTARLYGAAEKTRKRIEAQRAALHAQDSDRNTFTPKLNKNRRASSSSGDVGTRLYMVHAKKLKKQEALRNASPVDAFRPKISKGSARKQRKSLGGKERMHKMYEEAEKSRLRKQAKREAALASDENLTFKPKITKRGRRSASQSPAVRAKSYDRKKVLQDRENRKKAAEVAGCTFQPKLVSRRRSRSVTRNRSRGGREMSFLERTKAASDARAANLKKLHADKEARDMQGATFQPNVRSRSRSALRVRSRREGSEALHDRLYKSNELREERLALLRKEKESHEDFSFQPNARQKGKFAKRQTSRPSSKESIYERLSRRAEERKEKLKERNRLKAQRELENCTFQPRRSNAISTARNSSGDKNIWERMHDEGKQKKKIIEERAAAKEERELAHCTFQPTTSSSGTPIVAKGEKKIWKRLYETETSSLRHAKGEEEERPLDENHTFTPNVSEMSKSLVRSKSDIWTRMTKESETKAEKVKRLALEKERRELAQLKTPPKSTKKLNNKKVNSFLERVRIADELKKSARKAARPSTESNQLTPKISPLVSPKNAIETYEENEGNEESNQLTPKISPLVSPKNAIETYEENEGNEESQDTLENFSLFEKDTGALDLSAGIGTEENAGVFDQEEGSESSDSNLSPKEY
eukprot:g1686.t1